MICTLGPGARVGVKNSTPHRLGSTACAWLGLNGPPHRGAELPMCPCDVDGHRSADSRNTGHRAPRSISRRPKVWPPFATATTAAVIVQIEAIYRRKGPTLAGNVDPNRVQVDHRPQAAREVYAIKPPGPPAVPGAVLSADQGGRLVTHCTSKGDSLAHNYPQPSR
jgi:hypothetical protein